MSYRVARAHDARPTPGMSTIFVQIAAYRDPELVPTLRDCVRKARHPEQLRFGICWQKDDTESLHEFARDERFRIIPVDYRDSRGVCWARSQIQQLYRGETYTLQLDSHHRFIPDWDAELVAMMALTGSQKPILTAFGPSYDPFDDSKFVHVPWRMVFSRFTPEGVAFFMPQAIDNFSELHAPLRARFFSAHFTFTTGSFCHEVPYDPHYYFHGEEINMAVRAFTHGYDLFHPPKVVVWHEYTRQYRTKHWDDHTAEKQVATPWTTRNDESHRRNRVLFGMETGDIDFGKYGFGTARTLRDYEDYAGISFRLRLAQEYTLRNEPPPNPVVYRTDQEWRDHCIKEFWTRIRLRRADVPDADDCDFWYVGVHDRHGGELFRNDLTPAQIEDILQQPEPHFIFTYRSSLRAHSWTVWPHSKSKGWLTKITVPMS